MTICVQTWWNQFWTSSNESSSGKNRQTSLQTSLGRRSWGAGGASSFSRCIGDRGNGDRKTCRTCDTKSKVSPPSWSLTTCRIEFKRSSLDNQRCVLCVTKNIAASFVWLRIVPSTLVSETRKHHCQFWKNQLAPHWPKKDQATTAATEGETMWHLNCIQVWMISGGMWIVLLLNLSKSHLSTLSNSAVSNTAQFV